MYIYILYAVYYAPFILVDLYMSFLYIPLILLIQVRVNFFFFQIKNALYDFFLYHLKESSQRNANSKEKMATLPTTNWCF